MSMPSPFLPWDFSVGVVTTGGDAKVPSKWGEEPFTCRVTTQHDTWLNLDDHHRYITAADSFNNSNTQMRRQQVQGPYVAGKFTTSAVPDQVTENVSFYVLGDNQSDMQVNLADLIAAFTQPAYQLVWSVGEAAYSWDCETADYSIDFTNVGFYARTLTAKFQVPRNPTLLLGSLW